MAQLEKLKLTASTWDSDKDPNGFFTWLETFSSLVQTTEGGRPLEEFIAHKTGREMSAQASVPSFLLNDADFDMGPDVDAGLFSENASVPDSAIHKEAGETGDSPIKRRVRQRMESRSMPMGGMHEIAEAIQSIRTGVSKRTLRRAPQTYLELPEASRTLNGHQRNQSCVTQLH
jgi:hypothetical protein